MTRERTVDVVLSAYGTAGQHTAKELDDRTKRLNSNTPCSLRRSTTLRSA